MRKTGYIFTAILIAFLLASAAGAFAAGGKLTIDVASRYTGGETVMMKIHYTAEDGSPVVLDNPAKLKVQIKKPDGSLVASEARRGGWSKPGEYFDVYTLDNMGRYELTVSDPGTGATASASLDSVFLTVSSLGVIIFAVVLLVAAIVYWVIASKKKKAKA